MKICWSAFLYAYIYMLLFIKCVILYIKKDVRCYWKSVEDMGKWERLSVNFDYEQFLYSIWKVITENKYMIHYGVNMNENNFIKESSFI